jgi:hypothetical protein
MIDRPQQRPFGVMFLAVILGLLHLPAIALLVNETVRVPDGIFVVSFFVGFPLQVLAFLITAIAVAVSRSVRRALTVWIVTGVGVIAMLFWLATYGSDWV